MTFPITAHLPSTNGKMIPTVKTATDGPVAIPTSAKVTYEQADFCKYYFKINRAFTVLDTILNSC